MQRIKKQVSYCTFKQIVKKRKHEINQAELAIFLKGFLKISRRELAERLNIPKTEVEHWFRTDACGSIPPPEHWENLKIELGIKECIYDKAITEFENVEGVFDTAERCYFPQAVSPTITCEINQKVIKRWTISNLQKQ